MTENNAPVRIVLADDHTIFRDGLRNLLDGQPGLTVVGEARDGQETLDMVARLNPDILLLDLSMPKVTGIEVLRSLVAADAKVKTIVLSGTIEGDQIIEAFRLGARGLVLKEMATNLLFKSINCVMMGQYWIGRQAASDLIETLRRVEDTRVTRGKRKDFGLTAREKQIVQAVVSGYTNKDIAAQLSISEQTVKHHLSNIFDKVGAFNRLELALFAVHHGLVDNQP